MQSGDFESFRSERPPRDYFHRRNSPSAEPDFGEDEFFNGGLSIRATVDPEMQVEAAHALQRALEHMTVAAALARHWQNDRARER